LGIPATTVRVLSTDNLGRAPDEISGILSAVESTLSVLARKGLMPERGSIVDATIIATDVEVVDELLHGMEGVGHADSGCTGADKRVQRSNGRDPEAEAGSRAPKTAIQTPRSPTRARERPTIRLCVA
jgi:hypothetical protein